LFSNKKNQIFFLISEADLRRTEYYTANWSSIEKIWMLKAVHRIIQGKVYFKQWLYKLMKRNRPLKQVFCKRSVLSSTC